jgi:hypothetical protein
MNLEAVKSLAEQLTYEELAAALYVKGELDGFHKVTDKTKWREPVMAEKLGHVAHSKISAGAGSDEYGSDAWDEKRGMFAEYKSKAIEDKQLNNLFQRVRYPKTGKLFSSLKIQGVYNGAYKQSALDAYALVDHYYGVFYKETCMMIIRPNTEEVIRQLSYNNAKRKPGQTTNLNIVNIDLADKSLYTVVYTNEEYDEFD